MFKTIYIPLLFCFCCSYLGAQDNALQLPALQIYPFNNQYINLATFQKFELEELPALTFKSKSIYATRFRGLAVDKLVFKGKMFETQSDNGLLFTDLSTKAAMLLPNREKGFERFGQNFLIESADGMVYIKNLNSDHGYMIYKYDANGNELLGVQLPHSEWIEKPKLKYQRPFLKYLTHTKWQLLFTSYLKEKPKTYLVELSNGQILEYDFIAQGIIRDEKEDAFIHGFIQVDAALGKMNVSHRTETFDIAHPKLKDCNRVETVLRGDILFLAAFNERTSGLSLFALDLKNKQFIWESEWRPTPAANVAASSYYNMVWLSISGEQLLLEGMEPSLRYLHVFDLKTGKNLHQFQGNK